jgi:4-hydroxy-tetrahydrodipicolinate synthase
MRGVYPILVTPFDEKDRIDEDSLRNLVDYCIGAGVHGLGIAFATEIPKLTESERLRVAQVVIDQADGRVPLVVNTGAPSTYATLLYSRQAADAGAAAVMCTAPSGAPSEEILAYFRALSDAMRVPIFLQEAATAIGGAQMRRIAAECERLRYAKVESAPPPQRVREAVQHGGELVTVFGGASGSHLIEELRRGSQGTMPWPSLPHSFVRIWDFWEAGAEDEARQTWEREIHPVLRIGGLVHKEILYRQGVIRTPRFRSPAPAQPLDEIAQREFDEVCERLGIGR